MKNYCLIGRQENDIRYSIIDLGPLTAEDATKKRSKLKLPSCTITSYEKAAYILTQLNKNVETMLSPPDIDTALVQAQQAISGAIKQYLLISSQLGKRVEVFVGHENYEVEITCKQ